jgi:uncharacterized protein
MRLILRPAAEADWPTVLAINADGVPGVSGLDRAELSRLATEATYFQVAERGGVVLGYLLAFAPSAAYGGEEFLWFREHAPRALYVDQVAVADSARRDGIATRLYGDTITFAAERGFESLACEINLRPPNPTSLNFHRAIGFESCGKFKTSDGRTVSLQLLDLSRARA